MSYKLKLDTAYVIGSDTAIVELLSEAFETVYGDTEHPLSLMTDDAQDAFVKTINVVWIVGGTVPSYVHDMCDILLAHRPSLIVFEGTEHARRTAFEGYAKLLTTPMVHVAQEQPDSRMLDNWLGAVRLYRGFNDIHHEVYALYRKRKSMQDIADKLSVTLGHISNVVRVNRIIREGM